MYPQSELTRLAACKAGLRRTIALRRSHCAAAAARVARPLVWLDRLVSLARRLAPLAATPVILSLIQAFLPRGKRLAVLVGWGPLVLAALRAFTPALRARFGPPAAATSPA